MKEELEIKLDLLAFSIAMFVCIPLNILTGSVYWVYIMFGLLGITFIYGVVAHRDEIKDWNWGLLVK